jgi:uncharacterized protein YegP (UPF0339 family)
MSVQRIGRDQADSLSAHPPAKQLNVCRLRATITVPVSHPGVPIMRRVLAVIAVVIAPVTLSAARADKLKFEIHKDNKMEFRWRLISSNGKTLATSGQGYKAKADCKNGVERIKKDAADKLKFEIYEDNAKQFRFRIVASNGQTIGSSSESYKVKADCEKAVDLIKKGAKESEVAEV